MAHDQPLRGLRVVELASGIALPYAGRLLTMLGATVVKIEPPGGDPTRTLAVDDGPTQRPGPVFVHLAAGKRLVDRARTDEALRWADVVLDDGVLNGASPVPPGAVPLLVRVVGDPELPLRPGTPADELLAQASSGLLDISRGDDGRPLRFPGWQTQYLAGAYAAAAALTGLADGARCVEVSWFTAALAAVEAQVATRLDAVGGPDPQGRPRGGFLLTTFPSGVFPCADGHVVPGTVRPADWTGQCHVYGRPELTVDPRFVWANRWANRAALRRELEPWYRAHRRDDIVAAGLEVDWAVAPVVTANDVLSDGHLADRRFLAPVHGATSARVPARPWRSRDAAEGRPVRLSEPGGDTAWFDVDRGPDRRDDGAGPPRPPAAARLRVLELTWAWSGPLVGRFLGALGADVVKVETGAHPDGWRTRHRWRDVGPPPPGQGPDDWTWDAAPEWNSVNRDKRAVSVDLANPDGIAVFRDLLARADVLVVNMNHRMLEDRGLTGDVSAAVERGLIAITMPALGMTGRLRAMPGYGMLTEGLGGFAARYGPPAEGARTSTTYYPDAVAGVHGALAALAGLAGRSRTGRGQWADLSQQETMWLQLGEGIVLADREGRSPGRTGAREPGVACSGLLQTSDGDVAYVGAATAEALTGDQLVWAGTRPAGEVCERLRADGIAAEPVRETGALWVEGVLGRRGAAAPVAHPVTGVRPSLASPLAIDGEPVRTTRPAPLFDQHTDEVLTQWLGLPPARIAELRAGGAVGTRARASRRRKPLSPAPGAAEDSRPGQPQPPAVSRS